MFRFLEFDDLKDDEIKLVLKSRDKEEGFAPRYGFSIIHIEDNEEIGVVYFAVDTEPKRYLKRGHLSYGVSPAYAGNNYAVKACKLVKQVALTHGFTDLYVGAVRDNIASIKTIEKLGAQPLVTVHDKEVLSYLESENIAMYVWNIAQ